MSAAQANSKKREIWPLADRMRPTTLADFAGQSQLLSDGKPLTRLVSANSLHSAVFWGPPGTGKTTLARLIAHAAAARFVAMSAVMVGVKEIRQAVAEARESDQPTVLFLDEVHRFNKAQQDAFLPVIEDGTIVFVGATTENPSFALNNALLSRARVYVLNPLSVDELVAVQRRALSDEANGYGNATIEVADENLRRLAAAADGDARRALNLLELAVDLCGGASSAATVLHDDAINAALSGSLRRFDRQGDVFYEQISALHKSVRGSDPDAALYWFARMLDGGCDPLYISRRVLRMASEDIGNADPRALRIALDAAETFERLGSPEGELAIAQAVVFLASAAKSNAVYTAFGAARQDAQANGTLAVPKHLRNAPTALMRELGHGESYRYAHDEAGGFVPGEHYFPEEMQAQTYYRPVDRGLERSIGEKLAELRERNISVKKQ